MSTKNPLNRRVFFSVHASAFAAHFFHPEEEHLEAVASSCLPATGGRAEAHVHHHRKGMFYVESAHSVVHGGLVRPGEGDSRDHDHEHLPAHTSAKVTIQGFRIEAPRDREVAGSFERTLRIQHLGSELESLHEGNGPNKFKSLRVTIDGVSVDGRSLIIETNPELFLHNPIGGTGAVKEGRNQILYQNDGITLGTVVTGIRWENGAPEQTEIVGNRVTIKGLGSLYFGEILVEEGFRRLTLVRAQLGCVNSGAGTVGDTASKVNWVPPH